MRPTGLWLLRASVPLGALALAAAIGAVVVAIVGGDPGRVVSIMIRYNLGSINSVADLLARSVPLMFSGLAAAIAFRAGIFNIGTEGQYRVAAFAAAWVGAYPGPFPAWIHLPLTVAAGMAGGVVWAAAPLYLRVRRGVHEVISTLMLNFVASSLLMWLIGDVFRDPFQGEGTTLRVRMPPVAETALMPRMHGLLRAMGIVLRNSVSLNGFFPVALATCAAVYLLLWRTPFGFEVRTVGLNPQAARSAGIAVERVRAQAFLLSGALAGLIGLPDLLGYFGYLDVDFPSGYGFTGIAVALLGGNHPLGVIPTALLFAFLQRAGLGIQALAAVPREVVTVLEGTVILTTAIATAAGSRWVQRMERHRAGRGAAGVAARAASQAGAGAGA